MQKKAPKSSKNEMLIFGLCSTSDDWLSDLSDESQPKCEKGPLIHKKVNSYFWITFNFWWSTEQSEWQKSTKMQKRPLSHQKIKCSFLDYVQLLMICRVIWVTKVNCNANKGPLSHQKINSHFWITFNFWWSAEQSEWQKSTKMQKRPSKSSKNEMLIFGLCSTSDDWPSDLSDESQPKCKIRPLSHQNIILIFGLHSTSDDSAEQSEQQKSTKMWKRPPKSSKNQMLILDYFQLLMIGWAILATKVNQNAKKGPLSHQKWNAHFWIMFNFWWLAEQSEWWNSAEMQIKAP